MTAKNDEHTGQGTGRREVDWLVGKSSKPEMDGRREKRESEKTKTTENWMRIFERKCREVINWWTVWFCWLVGWFFRKRRVHNDVKMIIFRRSTFTLIGRRALQKCVFCHKHNKTHNGNAFHMWKKKFLWALLLPFSFIHSFVRFYFHFSFGVAMDSVSFAAMNLLCLQAKSAVLCFFSFISFRCLALDHSCESISWWSVIESPHWWSLHWVADDGRRVPYIINSKQQQQHTVILARSHSRTQCVH